MKNVKGSIGLAGLLLGTLLVSQIMLPTDAWARWHSRYDELPGYDSGEMMKKVAIIGGAALVLGLIIKSSNHKSVEPAAPAPADASQVGSTVMLSPSAWTQLTDLAVQPAAQPRLVPYVDLLPAPAAIGGSNGHAVSLGVAFRF